MYIGSFHAKSKKKLLSEATIFNFDDIRYTSRYIDIYDRTSEPNYGPTLASSYGETETGSSASTRLSAQSPDLQRAITFSFL